ncbi:MAG: hypothetical protein QW560_03805 [Candidatus Nitrosocaldus sp.]
MSKVRYTILMRYELKGHRLRRRYNVEDGMMMMITNIMIGGTVIALVLALPTVAILLTIYYISSDAMLAALASLAVHYAILLLLVEWVSMKIYSMLDEEDGEREEKRKKRKEKEKEKEDVDYEHSVRRVEV